MPSDKSDAISDKERPRRLRGRNACTQCRTRKVRCSNTLPRCATCVKHNRPCSYSILDSPRQRKNDLERGYEYNFPFTLSADIAFTTHNPVSVEDDSHLSSDSGEERPKRYPSHQEAIELARNFFEHLYPVPSYSFLHPCTTLTGCQQGVLERPLLLAICALTSLHVTVSGVAVTREASDEWVADVEEMIWRCLEHPSMSRLQALLLTISYRIATGSYEKAFMITAIAARAASAMGLNHEHTHLGPISEEVRRRTVWCFKLLESYFSVGLIEFEVLPFENVYLRPPLCEELFGSQWQPGAEDFAIPALRDQKELGSLNSCIRLVSIRRDIMKLTRELSVCSEPYLQLTQVTGSLEEALLELKTEMRNCAEILTTDPKDSVQSPWLPRHMMMVALWHECYFDIYRVFLPGCPEAPPCAVLRGTDASFVQKAKRTCVEHALATVNLLCDLNQNCTEPRLLEFATSVSAYHAIRLLIFIAQSSTGPGIPSLEFAVSRAELCRAAIRRFFHGLALTQPVLDDMTQMIETFSSGDPVAESFSILHKAHHGRKSDRRIPPAA